MASTKPRNPGQTSSPTALRLAYACMFFCVTAILAMWAPPVQAGESAAYSEGDYSAFVNEFAVSAEVTKAGALNVTYTVSIDFFDDVHGPYFVLPLAQPTEGKDNYQVFQVSVGEVTQDGQAAVTEIEEDADTVSIRIGDPDVEISGDHTYTVDYTVSGVARGSDGEVVLPWDVLTAGAYSDWYIGRARVELTIPSGGNFSCTSGSEGSRFPCGDQSNSSGQQVAGAPATVYSAVVDDLGEGGVTVWATWPEELLSVPDPVVDYRPGFSERTGIGGIALAGSAAMLAIGVLVARGVRLKDWRYAGSAAGVAPSSRAFAPTETVRTHPSAIRYEPPQMHPSQAGLALTGKIDEGAVLVSLIASLAQRGHLHVSEYTDPLAVAVDAPDPQNWLLEVQDAPLDGCAPWEIAFLGAIRDPHSGEDADLGDDEGFDRSDFIAQFEESAAFREPGDDESRGTRLCQINNEVAATAVAAATADQARAWYTEPARPTAARWLRPVAWICTMGGLGLLAWGLIVGETGGYGLVALIAGIGLLLATVRQRVRTPDGSVAYEQAQGYSEYLSSDQNVLAAAEKHRLFTAALPWAISMGIVNEWANALTDAEKDASVEDQFAWYSGPAGYTTAGLATSMGTMSTAAGTAATTVGARESFESAASAVSSNSAGSGGSVGGGSFGSGGGSW